MTNPKADHVRNAKQTRRHGCHWWGCRDHWFRLPKRLRDRVWAAYVPGQEELTPLPTDEYLAVAQEVQEWIEAMGTTTA